MLKYLLPRLHDILFLAVFLGALLLGPRMLSLDSDLGRHLTLGNTILDHRTIPTTDILSFTKSGEPRPPYEWLTQVFFALANRLAGLDGVILFCALIIALAFTRVYSDAARRSAMPLGALAIAMLAVAASSLHWLPRPHVVTFLLLSVWIERLERVRRDEPIPLWQFPALMLFWVNAHGGFIFGVLAFVAYFAGWMWETAQKRILAKERVGMDAIGRKLLIVGSTSLLATFVTPSGWGNWQAVLNNNNRFLISHTVETMPPDFTQFGTLPFAVLLLIALVLLLATYKTIPASHFFLLAGFALLGLMMARNIPLFAIASTPVLAGRLAEVLLRVPRWRKIEGNITKLENPLRGAVWPVIVCGGIALLAGSRFEVRKEALIHFDVRVFPVAAADWLEAHPQSGNMFNDFNWGGYLLYRLWPGQKVFLDSQTDFYGEALVREYETALLADQGWDGVLKKYAVEWTILPPDAPLTDALQEAGWQTLYEDVTAIILRRK